MELREALAQISEIREQMARTEIFRGYHSVPVAITGVLAIAAACLLVGALITICLYVGPVETIWVLPGLWSVCFALGIFSSCRFLPPQVVWVGAYYLVCGCLCLLRGHSDQFFAPWQMGVSFGGGHVLTAAILYWTLERQHGTEIR